MGHEKIVEQVADVVAVKTVDGTARQPQMSIRRTANISLDLGQQAGNQVDRALKLGHLLKVQRHAQVILGCMETNPGHRVIPGHVVGVIRLMLMPDKRQ